MEKMNYNFYEFFAGGGMARAGLGSKWNCLFANDFDRKKSSTYQQNWGSKGFITSDVRNLSITHLPEKANLVWASFPCQDLSLAGGGAGLKGERSGTFWPFWDLMDELIKDGRAPETIVLENVCGTLSSHDGKDFETICKTLVDANYRFGVLVMDAKLFLPQSRPRLFFVAVRNNIYLQQELQSQVPDQLWHTKTLIHSYDKLPKRLKENWIWWNVPKPRTRTKNFSDIIEEKSQSIEWHSKDETERLLNMMSETNLEKVNNAKLLGQRAVGTIYRRTRREGGIKIQRAEIRFDDIAGCLRTPAGGSSRQIIMIVEGKKVRSRLISSRETARLMGLPEGYKLPQNYNEAYHLTGDGVAVPVVRHLARNIIEPTINGLQLQNIEWVA